MTNRKMKEIVTKILEMHEDDYGFIGIRFEDKEREIGEKCEYSKDNPDRYDERDFPEYGTAEYNNLPELDGTSAWYAEYYDYGNLDEEDAYTVKHCYVVGTKHHYLGSHPNPDQNEILLQDAEVIAKLW